MALTEEQIKIVIAAELRKQGFDKAQKATSSLEKSFKRLGFTIATTFSATKIIQFTNKSVRAFADEDRAIRALSGTLNNLGLAFEGANTEDFIAQLQKTAAVSDSELRPAFQTLANATLDVAKSQKLLGLALDISAATGKDLQTIVTGLTKAYLKDTSSLARLNLGLTDAELKTMSFAEAQAILTERFSGQAAAAADSYEGKIRKLNIAFDEASETVGKKVIRSLELLGNGDFDKILDAIGTAADKVGNGFIRMSYGIQKVKALLRGDFASIAKLQEAMNIELGGYGSRLGAPGALSKMKQQITLQTKLERDRAKAAALALKREKEQQALKRAGTVFDMEKIQIIAALQGRIDEEQRLRLTALLAINSENAEAAEKLSRAVLALNAASFASLGVTMTAADTVDTLILKVINAQAKLALVNSGIATIPKAKNPFEDWPDIMATILAQIAAIKSSLDFKATFDVKAPPPVAPSTISSSGQNPPKRGWIKVGNTWINPKTTISPEDLPDYKDPNPIIETPSWITDLFQGVDYRDTNDIPPTVVVNVAGSVVTQQDLTTSILNNMYTYQKAGGRVTYATAQI